MSRLRWRGVDLRGAPLSGLCRADSVSALRHALARHGVAAIHIEREVWRRRQRRTADGARAAALRRLTAILVAGAPLDQALRAAAAQEHDPDLRRALRAVRSAVEHGTALSEAFAAAFPALRPVHLALLRAGERSGDLGGALEQVAAELERRTALHRKIRQATAYPAAISVAAGGLIALLMLFVVPRFEAVFRSSGEDLPTITRGIIALSDALAVVAPLLLVAAGSATIIGVGIARRHGAGRRRAVRAVARVPWLGGVLLDAALSRWCATLSQLLAAGIPLLEALPNVAQTATETPLAARLPRLEADIRAGKRFTAALRSHLPEATTAIQLIAVGEESGRLDEMLHHAAEHYQHRLEERLARATALIEPILIVALGAITAVVVAALYLPVFELGTTL